jgi:hypothetical protein
MKREGAWENLTIRNFHVRPHPLQSEPTLTAPYYPATALPVRINKEQPPLQAASTKRVFSKISVAGMRSPASLNSTAVYDYFGSWPEPI